MREEEYRLIDDVLEGRLSRRDLIKGLAAAGFSMSAISGLLAETGIADAAGSVAHPEARPLAPKRGGTLRIGTTVPATDVDPVTMFNQGAIYTAQMSCEYLCYPRGNETLMPKLATSWHHTGKPDTWVFNLRTGVKWQNGKPFTADDVVYTMNLIADPANKSAGALAAFKGILSKGNVRKVNSHQVVFHLDRPYVDFPYLVSAFNYNALILPKGYKVGTFTKGGVGTGPYVLTQYTPKLSATYKRNPHYWAKGKPYPDGAQLKYYSEGQAIVLAIQSGAIDMYPNLPYQGSQALFHDPNIHIFKNKSSAYREFHMRVDKAPFNDKRVRQAVALSLDRKAIIQTLWGGNSTLGNDHAFAPIYPLSKVTKAIPQRKLDIAQAKRLLAAAGHPRGFSATLTTEDYLEIKQYVQVVQQQLKKAGINITLNVEDQNTYYGTGNNQPWLDVPMGVVDWAARGSASQTIDAAYLCHAVWNSANWCNKRFTTLVNAADAELNKTKRNQMVLEAAKIQHDEVPAVIAYWIQELTAIRPNVHGFKQPGTASNIDPSPLWLA